MKKLLSPLAATLGAIILTSTVTTSVIDINNNLHDNAKLQKHQIPNTKFTSYLYQLAANQFIKTQLNNNDSFNLLLINTSNPNHIIITTLQANIPGKFIGIRGQKITDHSFIFWNQLDHKSLIYFNISDQKNIIIKKIKLKREGIMTVVAPTTILIQTALIDNYLLDLTNINDIKITNLRLKNINLVFNPQYPPQVIKSGIILATVNDNNSENSVELYLINLTNAMTPVTTKINLANSDTANINILKIDNYQVFINLKQWDDKIKNNGKLYLLDFSTKNLQPTINYLQTNVFVNMQQNPVAVINKQQILVTVKAENENDYLSFVDFSDLNNIKKINITLTAALTNANIICVNFFTINHILITIMKNGLQTFNVDISNLLATKWESLALGIGHNLDNILHASLNSAIVINHQTSDAWLVSW